MTMATPARPEEVAEALTDKDKLAALMGADGKLDTAKLQEFVASYTAETYRSDSMKAQLRAAVADGMKEFAAAAREGGAEPRLGHMADAKPQTYASLGLNREQRRQVAATGRGPGVALAGHWASLAEFMSAISPQSIARNGVPKILNDMSEAVSGDGGFLVPEEFRAELMVLALESALVRPRARVIPMSTTTVRLPSIRDASHASTVFGGVSASWVAEAASLASVTQPTFAQIALTVRKLTGYTVASNELLADSAISLEALILALFGDALAYFEDDAFIAGTGAGQPLGVLNAAAMVSVTKETGQAAATIVYENLVKAFSRVLPQSMGTGVWYAHPDTFPQLAALSLAIGTGGSAVWISNIADGPPATIFGRPVIFTEKAKTLGTAGDIVFADFGFYLIGDRQAMQMASSPHVNFTTDEMAWRFVQRVDGRPWIQSALTPRNGTNTMSPFVSIATRS